MAIFTRDVKGQTQRCWTTNRSKQRERQTKQCWRNSQGEQTPVSGEHLKVDLDSWHPHKGSRLRGDRSILKARILSPCLHPTWDDSGGAGKTRPAARSWKLSRGKKPSQVSNIPSSLSDKSSMQWHRITMTAKRSPGGLKAKVSKAVVPHDHTTFIPHGHNAIIP